MAGRLGTLLPIAFTHRDFRIFFTGLVLSGFGSQFTTVAMAWQIYQLTDSPLNIGLIGLARAVPQTGLLLFGGMLADTMDRRALMKITQVGQFCVSASLAVLTLAGLISPLALYVGSGLLALFTAFEQPSRQAIVPNLVPREHLASAVALNGAQRNTGAIAGPSLAGLLLAFGNPAYCYAIDATSWLVMLAALFMIRSGGRAGSGRGRAGLPFLVSGVRFVLGHPVVLSLMLLDFGATLFGSPRALFPVFARDLLHVGPSGLGVLYASTSVGAIVAGAVMSSLTRVRRAGLWVLLGVTFYSLCTVVFGLSGTFLLSVAMLGGLGAGDAVSQVLRGTIVQLLTPDDMRGRVTAVNSVFTSSGPQLGQFRAGVVAELWGAEAAVLSGAFATLLLVAGLAAIPAVRTFQLPSRSDAPVPDGDLPK